MNASVNAARAKLPNQAHGRDCDHHPSRDYETLLGSGYGGHFRAVQGFRYYGQKGLDA